MWSYYGRKKKIVRSYPVPAFGHIVEPFAGTASYAYEYWDTPQVTLIDKYDKVCKIWWYLQRVSPDEILGLPDVGVGQSLHNITWLCDEERWLIGYSINNGSAVPKKTSGKMGFNSWSRDKIRIANDLYKIRHWHIIEADYTEVANWRATWFIDPPYQHNKYPYGYAPKPDYVKLGEWCKERNGQVIACDNLGADWLPFEPLITMTGQRKPRVECMWHKYA